MNVFGNVFEDSGENVFLDVFGPTLSSTATASALTRYNTSSEALGRSAASSDVIPRQGQDSNYLGR